MFAPPASRSRTRGAEAVALRRVASARPEGPAGRGLVWFCCLRGECFERGLEGCDTAYDYEVVFFFGVGRHRDWGVRCCIWML